MINVRIMKVRNIMNRMVAFMLLAIDAGNTNIVFGIYDKDELLYTFRTETYKSCDAGKKYGEILPGMFGDFENRIDAAVMSSVVPSVNNVISSFVEEKFGCSVLFVSSKTENGIKIKSDKPEVVGADLICAAAEAYLKYKTSVIVFDLGTAATVTAIDKQGNFLGTSISPGLNISMKALADAASLLTEINLNEPDISVIGKNTADSIRSGIVIGAACFIDGMTERYKNILGEESHVIITGGLSTLVLPYCMTSPEYVENLVLDGIKDIYYLNRSGK